ncbi:excinuclease ABC subunit UvrA [Candidatus Poribacteria bacterium]|nr:excinuclease ABC subunit UvrA [Candidatus Poribacteria bacterium]
MPRGPSGNPTDPLANTGITAAPAVPGVPEGTPLSVRRTEYRDVVSVRGARVHNLQNIDLDLPKNSLIVFTGVSGSGKSSLAFDTLYAEGQRRYVESLSAYARQFLGQMEKPDVDFIGGLSPTISIDQKSTGHNPRSTVATITEVYDYLRLLFARVGELHCLECGKPVGMQTRDEIIDRLMELPDGQRVQILAPIVQGRKGEYREELADALKAGFARARIDGQVFELTDTVDLDRSLRHNIEIIVDRIQVREGIRDRLSESIETAMKLAGGTMIADLMDGTEHFFSQKYACAECGISYEEPSPQAFSFNSPKGACSACNGLGETIRMSPAKVVADTSKSIRQGAIAFWGDLGTLRVRHVAESLAVHMKFSLDTPWRDLPETTREAVLYGCGRERIHFVYKNHRGREFHYDSRYEGVIPPEERHYFDADNENARRWYSRFMDAQSCPECHGSRLRPEARAVHIAGKTILDVTEMSVQDARAFFTDLPLTKRQETIAEQVLKEIRGRLWFLSNVGLHYLSLNRTAPTLSGGEAQRIRLASQIGTGLVGVLYILDEPSIGLHARDNKKLLDTLKHLRDIGNTIIVVEHDEETMRAADFIADFGPGAGVKGGNLVVSGSPAKVAATPESITGQYLAHQRAIPIPESRRAPNGKWLGIRNARQNNLKSLDIDLPLGVFTAVTGVSGSGKSSLLNDILAKALLRDLMRAEETPGDYDAIEGVEHLDKAIVIDQSPIGRTPRSNPATYVKLFDHIRNLFAELPESRVRGYQPGRFSFNVKGGRCEACEGNGLKRVEMHFLADVWVKCEVCNGARFNDETLAVLYKGKSISEVLDMDVQEALTHFADIPKIRRVLKTLHDVGLDYIKLGQPAPTLSGGEAQRVKLAKELARVATGRTLYILDEPTTGLHFEDVRKLLEVLHKLVDKGNSVIVIEHNMEVIKTADHIIDLGPEGGEEGGYLVAIGTPEELAHGVVVGELPSATGRILRQVLGIDGESRPELSDHTDDSTPRSELIDEIRVVGAREHNLQNVSVNIPQGKMVAFTGVSGSGKTSLAIDTIYAEGQRRYVESLSAYARQFLGQMEKPRVEHIEGLSPAIAIDQKQPSKSPRSTVGTVTEVYDYLRVLFARAGTAHCPECHRPVGSQSVQQIADNILRLPEGSRLHVLAPVQLARGEEYAEVFDRAAKRGFARVWINGKVEELPTAVVLDRRIRHDVGIVVDRVILRKDERSRLSEAVEVALREGKGVLRIVGVSPNEDGDETPVSESFSEHFACVPCGLSFKPLTPKNFSFNSPLGMCPRCEGIGRVVGADQSLIVPNPRKSIRAGAVLVWGEVTSEHPMSPFLVVLAKKMGFSLTTPFEKLPDEVREIILYGSREVFDVNGGRARFRGAAGGTDWVHVRGAFARDIRPFLREVDCPTCRGSRLQPFALSVQLGGKTIVEWTRITIREALDAMMSLRLTGQLEAVARDLREEISNRLRFLCDVGLDYLTLARPAPSLSGGEAQRIRLASQLGSGLTGVLYVLDEPTIGLHPRDNDRLIKALHRLRDLGNTVLVVEHDEETIRTADHILDFGPRAGTHGGEIVAQGSLSVLESTKSSLTGQYLSGVEAIPKPPKRRRGRNAALEIIGATHRNLKNVDVSIPLGTLTCVTGVSGSGKSSLIEETLYPVLARKLNGASTHAGAHRAIRGMEHLDKVINVDQKPIGETPRSNPATYTDVFTDIRYLYAELPDAQARGFDSRRFSANLAEGQCETCRGNGYTRIEMQFLPDVWIECDACAGSGYNKATLQVRYRDKSIADVLKMTAADAREHFAKIPKVARKLQTLCDVGLDYIQLGQSGTTLSGGEAQRVKLARELARRSSAGTVYVMDEPTTGLHFDDVRKLLEVLHRLVDQGSTVVVIEHNMNVIAASDHVIDLGPEGGDAGGYVVGTGTPEDIARIDASHTGRFLRPILGH